MLKWMWQKRGQTWDGGWKKILWFFLGLQAFCTLGDIWVMAVEKNGQEIQASRDFQLLITSAEEKKNLLPMYSQGQAIHIQGLPQAQRAKRMVLHLQINQKHSPGN